MRLRHFASIPQFETEEKPYELILFEKWFRTSQLSKSFTSLRSHLRIIQSCAGRNKNEHWFAASLEEPYSVMRAVVTKSYPFPSG